VSDINSDLLIQLQHCHQLTELPDARSLILKYPQLQQNNSDCGLFAIATALTVALGKDPSFVIFDQSSMREHLKKCFEQQKLTEYPNVYKFSPAN